VADVVNNTVVDGQVTWTCRTFAITDANCPHTKQVAKQAQKMFAVGTDATTVRFCKTGDPRDWTATNDAGFLAAGLYARGSDQVTSLNIYGNSSLAVFFSDNAQLWLVDPNPRTWASPRTSRAWGRSTTAPPARCRTTSTSSRRAAIDRCRS
jgi:hypothetical protein